MASYELVAKYHPDEEIRIKFGQQYIEDLTSSGKYKKLIDILKDDGFPEPVRASSQQRIDEAARKHLEFLKKYRESLRSDLYNESYELAATNEISDEIREDALQTMINVAKHDEMFGLDWLVKILNENRLPESLMKTVEESMGPCIESALNSGAKNPYSLAKSDKIPIKYRRIAMENYIDSLAKEGRYEFLIDALYDEDLPEELRNMAAEKIDEAARRALVNYVSQSNLHELERLALASDVKNQIREDALCYFISICVKKGDYIFLKNLSEKLPEDLRGPVEKAIDTAAIIALTRSLSPDNYFDMAHDNSLSTETRRTALRKAVFTAYEQHPEHLSWWYPVLINDLPEELELESVLEELAKRIAQKEGDKT